jgi:beta-mannosidase
LKTTYDLAGLDWVVAGFHPHAWRLEPNLIVRDSRQAETPALPAPVPGSVQQALLDAGRVPDWYLGLNAERCEWVENRHWIYEVVLPDEWFEAVKEVRLRCIGLDGNGLIRLNGQEIAAFANSYVPHVVDLTPYLAASGNRLQIVFECPPRWLGQFGYTSRMTAWKPRFNYHWDWTARLVQIGIWDAVAVEIVDAGEIDGLRVTTDADRDPPFGQLELAGSVKGQGAAVRCSLSARDAASGTVPIREQTVDLAADIGTAGLRTFELSWEDLDVSLWWPNGYGDQPRYDLVVELLDDGQGVLDRVERTVGFRHIEWQPCLDAPEGADPWLCVVNGRPIFLQGFNWTPIRPDFADVKPAAYEQRLKLYRDLHVNVLRGWGGAVLEREVFFDLCDALGLLVWQEFPLSSSGIDNYAPDDPASIDALVEIARSYVARRQHHASLLLWCGGNELMDDKDGDRENGGPPLDVAHPLLKALGDVVREMDPKRRFLATSASGPRESADPKDFGEGVHWDVHGPWQAEGALDDRWQEFWTGDDALFRSEVGAPGPSSAELIRRFAGDIDPYPGTLANPLWRRTSWWIEWPEYVADVGREPETLEAYVAWGQQRQARALSIAAAACKGRFPRCGGFIVWMGHDCFPCTANTSVIDFDGNPKPAAFALAEIFRR